MLIDLKTSIHFREFMVKQLGLKVLNRLSCSHRLQDKKLPNYTNLKARYISYSVKTQVLLFMNAGLIEFLIEFDYVDAIQNRIAGFIDYTINITVLL